MPFRVFRPIIPGVLCCFAAMLLLLLVTLSPPISETISFLTVTTGGKRVHYGVFGFTGSTRQIGYYFPIDSLNTTFLHILTKALFLHAIATAFSLLALIIGLCGAFIPVPGVGVGGTFSMLIAAALAGLATALAWAFDMVLFFIARHQFGKAGKQADLGSAVWLTLTAFVVLAVGFGVSVYIFQTKLNKSTKNSDNTAEDQESGEVTNDK